MPTKIATQQWSYEVNAQTYYGTSNGTSSSGYCLNMLTQGLLLSPIVLKTGGSFCGVSGAAGHVVTSGRAGRRRGQRCAAELTQ